MYFIDCGTLRTNTTLHVSSVNATENIFDSMGTATCEVGYRLTNSSNNSDIAQAVRCEESGTWTQFIGCETKGFYELNLFFKI